MARRTRYTEYKDRYANYNFELTDDGILFMTVVDVVPGAR